LPQNADDGHDEIRPEISIIPGRHPTREVESLTSCLQGRFAQRVSAHLAIYAKDEPGALVFPGAKSGPIRRGNFNKMAALPQAVASIGMPGLHFHDLRHAGNQFAADSGAGLRDLMARMSHDSERAAMVYQHVARGADQVITSAIDTHVQGEKRKDEDGEEGAAGALVPAGPLDRCNRSLLAACPVGPPST
jgi:integrase